jgi:hypothetical protein
MISLALENKNKEFLQIPSSNRGQTGIDSYLGPIIYRKKYSHSIYLRCSQFSGWLENEKILFCEKYDLPVDE